MSRPDYKDVERVVLGIACLVPVVVEARCSDKYFFSSCFCLLFYIYMSNYIRARSLLNAHGGSHYRTTYTAKIAVCPGSDSEILCDAGYLKKFGAIERRTN